MNVLSSAKPALDEVVEYCQVFRSAIKADVDARVLTLSTDGVFDPRHCVALAEYIGRRWNKELVFIQSQCLSRVLFPELPTIKIYGCDGFGDMIPDVWLMVWRKKCDRPEATSIHDHAASHAGVYVVDGEVSEYIYSVDPMSWATGKDKLPFSVTRRFLKKGDGASIDVPYIHRMMNHRRDGCGVHVYAPPLDAQTSYIIDGKFLYRSSTWKEMELSECA